MSWKDKTSAALRELAEKVDSGEVDAVALVYHLSGNINACIMHGSAQSGDQALVEKMAGYLNEWASFPYVVEGGAN